MASSAGNPKNKSFVFHCFLYILNFLVKQGRCTLQKDSWQTRKIRAQESKNQVVFSTFFLLFSRHFYLPDQIRKSYSQKDSGLKINVCFFLSSLYWDSWSNKENSLKIYYSPDQETFWHGISPKKFLKINGWTEKKIFLLGNSQIKICFSLFSPYFVLSSQTWKSHMHKRFIAKPRNILA